MVSICYHKDGLDPAYYAFFDDDILYDLASAGSGEFQNATDRRIKYNTPSLKAQAHLNGAETRVNEFHHNVTGSSNFSTIPANSVEFVDLFSKAPDPFSAQNEGLRMGPLGSSDIKTKYAPAWHINLLHGEIGSSTPYYTANLTASSPGTGHGYVQPIPQLNIELDYKTFFSTPEERSFGSINYTEVSAPLNGGNIVLYVEEKYLLVDIEEINGIFGKDNFTVEVFLSGSPHVSAPEGQLSRLVFADDDFPISQQLGPETVDYHLNLRIDDEIPNAFQKAHDIEAKITRGTQARLRLGRDLYGDTPNAEPCEEP